VEIVLFAIETHSCTGQINIVGNTVLYMLAWYCVYRFIPVWAVLERSMLVDSGVWNAWNDN